MKNILINYNNVSSAADDLSDISGMDDRGLWCALLVKKIKNKKNLNILFPKDVSNEKIDVEIDINANPIEKKSKKRIGLFMETPEIAPNNNLSSLDYYDYVISSDKIFKNKSRFIYSELPCWDVNALSKNIKLNKSNNTYSMICGNKKFRTNISSEDLYKKRRLIIKFFEKKYPDYFNLYGPGWDIHPLAVMYPRIGKFLKRFNINGIMHCYRGTCLKKSTAIISSCFNFCMENCTYPNYISEKYFDAILYGAVPIYYSNSVLKDIDSDSFINFANFNNPHDLVNYCNSLSTHERNQILENGKETLANMGMKYTHQNYTKIIYDAIERCI